MINLIKKKIIYTLLISSILGINITFHVNASPSVQTNSTTNVSSNEYKNWNDSVENQIEIMDHKIEENTDSLKKYDLLLQKLNKSIDANNKNIKLLNAEIKSSNSIYNKRLRAMYVNNFPEDYFELLISSKNIDELISRVSFAKIILDHDNANLHKLQDAKKSKDEISRKLNNDKDKISEVKDNIIKETTQLKTQKYNKKVLINSLNVSNTSQGKYISLSRGSSSYNGIVNYAMNFLGVPYVWGGTTPSGFDCSGFIQYVYAHFGINLPRVSEDQQNCGVQIKDREDLQPGDLVFFGKPAYHVGMYVGNGRYIEAPHTGDVVKIATLYNYTSASRVN